MLATFSPSIRRASTNWICHLATPLRRLSLDSVPSRAHSVVVAQNLDLVSRSVPSDNQNVFDEPREPGECAAFVYSDPSTVVPSLYALAKAPLLASEKIERARTLMKGMRRGPSPHQHHLAGELAMIISSAEEQSNIDTMLKNLADEAADMDLYSAHAAKELVTRASLPIDTFLSFFGGLGWETLAKVKPMDVLHVPQWCPTGMPEPAHAFFLLLGNRRGPLYRQRDYVRVHKEEREHYVWVAEQVRELAPEFFRQYCVAKEKDQVTIKRLTRQADDFLVCISKRLFVMAVLDNLPEILRRQALIDSAGSRSQRSRFARDFQWSPPPLSAVVEAFGLDPRRHGQHILENKFLRWQQKRLWTRKRLKDISVNLIPNVEELGKFALALPLRHRPFASFLAHIYSMEDALLRPWYDEQVHSEDLVQHVLWSAELVRELSSYVAQVMRVSRANSVANTVPTVLCIGSGASRLRHYLDHILNKLSLDLDCISVAAAVPTLPSKGVAPPDYVPYSYSKVGLVNDGLPIPVENRLPLRQVLDTYRPDFVICSCMPPKADWSQAFRSCPSVIEYLLVGPANSDKSGDAYLTWGGASPFHKKGQASGAPRYVRDGFVRKEMTDLSALCLGTDDAPGHEGANSVVSFKRLLRPHLSYEQSTLPRLLGQRE